MSDEDTIEFDLNAEISKRKLLGALGTIGTASVLGTGATLALFSDEETIGNNTIQAGEIDLTVDWKVDYFGPGGRQTIADQDTPVNRPGPIVDLTDVKPGDVIEKTLSTHIDGNPAFLTLDLSVLADEDNGINNPEDAVNDAFDDSDGTSGGDLAENLNCVVWYDGFEDSDGNSGGSGGSPGNNRPDEGIWTASGDPTNDADFEEGLDSAGSPSDAFDTSSDLVIASGTLAELANTSDPILIDSQDQGDTPGDYSGSACYDSGSVQYIGCVCWLPRDVPGIEDNILQTDRLEYQIGFGAIQCRDNVASDGTPLSTDVATQPSGSGGGGNDSPTAGFVGGGQPFPGNVLAFDAALSSDSDGTIVQYDWQIKLSGTVVKTDSGETTTYEVPSTGGEDLIVTLTVTDDDGAVDSFSRVIVLAEDKDADGFADASPSDPAAPPGTDCNDTNPTINPGAPDPASPGDNIDNDCDAMVDEGPD